MKKRFNPAGTQMRKCHNKNGKTCLDCQLIMTVTSMAFSLIYFICVTIGALLMKKMFVFLFLSFVYSVDASKLIMKMLIVQLHVFIHILHQSINSLNMASCFLVSCRKQLLITSKACGKYNENVSEYCMVYFSTCSLYIYN